MEKTKTAMAAVLMAAVSAGGCNVRRARLVAWRSADVAVPAGEADARGARTYRVALPRAEAGERPMRAELVFVVPLADTPVDAMEVVLRGPGPESPPPTLRVARVATEMPVSWPAALGAASSEVAR
jgi:hypothetical protein